MAWDAPFLQTSFHDSCGCHARRKQIAELLRFPSSKSGDDLISLSQYTERARAGQKSIYYIAADSLAAAASAPFVEQLIKKDLEVRAKSSYCSARDSRLSSALGLLS